MGARPLRKKKPQPAPPNRWSDVVTIYEDPVTHNLLFTDGASEITVSAAAIMAADNLGQIQQMALDQLAGMRGRGALCRDCAFDDCNSDNCMCSCHLSHEASVVPSNLPWSDPNSDPMGDMRRWSSKRPTGTGWMTVDVPGAPVTPMTMQQVDAAQQAIRKMRIAPAPFLAPALKYTETAASRAFHREVDKSIRKWLRGRR